MHNNERKHNTKYGDRTKNKHFYHINEGLHFPMKRKRTLLNPIEPNITTHYLQERHTENKTPVS